MADPSWVGNMVMSQGLYRILKACYPQAIIDVMAPAWCCPLLSHVPGVNEAIAISLGHGTLEIGERRKLSLSLREKRYNRAYVLPNPFKSVLVLFSTGTPHRTGWCGEMRCGLLNDARILDKDTRPLVVERYVVLAYGGGTVLTTKDLPQPLLQPQLQVGEGEKLPTCSQSSLSAKHPIIGFCPGAGFGPVKRRPYYRYAESAKQLIDEGYQVVPFGSAKDREAGNEILTTLSIEQQAWYRNLAGETQLEQIVILLAACKTVVTNDSESIYVAVVPDHPLVALYGPSSPDFTPPLSHKARVVHLITGYHKVHKDDTAEDYHQGLTDITPRRVPEGLNDLLLQEEA